MFRVLLAVFLVFNTPAMAAQLLQPGDVAMQSQDDVTRFTLIGTQGYAGFTVPSAWRVHPWQSEPSALFLMADVVDPDLRKHAGGFMIDVVMPEADPDRKNIDARLPYRGLPRSHYKDWLLFRGTVGAMPNFIGAERTIAGTFFCVRAFYVDVHNADTRMEALLEALLDSADAAPGSYAPHAGETVQRKPIQ